MRLKPNSTSGIEGISRNGSDTSWRVRGTCTTTGKEKTFGSAPSVREAKIMLLRLEYTGKMVERLASSDSMYYHDVHNDEDLHIVQAGVMEASMGKVPSKTLKRQLAEVSKELKVQKQLVHDLQQITAAQRMVIADLTAKYTEETVDEAKA